MKIEEHQKIVNDILKCDDKVKLSSLLRTLSADYVQMTNDFEKADKERKAFALENSRLWLERNTNTGGEETEETEEDNKNDEPKKMTFEELYNSAEGDD